MDPQARILSIEDDPEMRSLLQLIFEKRGYRVIGVKKGELGLELLKSLKPDVVLLDLMLPDVDGWELYRLMKEDEELVRVPVIIVTARNEKRDAAKGHRVIGGDRFVQKPFEIKDLVEMVHEALTANRTVS